MTDQLSTLLHAGTDRVGPALPPPEEVRRTAERRRRRRRVTAALAVVAVGVVVAWAPQLSPLRTSVKPDVVTVVPTPSPRPDLLVDQPLMDPLTGHRDRTAAPEPLSSCVSSPLGWGAAESFGARYVDLEDPTTVWNEFVLRYDTVAQAHQAVTDVWRTSSACTERPGATSDPPTSPVPNPITQVDEWFASQRSTLANEKRSDQANNVYALRVGRRGNIVVVIEDRGEPDDRAVELLSEALSTATGIRP